MWADCLERDPLQLDPLNTTPMYTTLVGVTTQCTAVNIVRKQKPVLCCRFSVSVDGVETVLWLQAIPQSTANDTAADAGTDDLTAKKPEPEIDTPRQRLLDPTIENDTSRFLVHQNGVATMTYVARLPEALSRWTLAVSLSPTDWSPSGECELVHAAQRLLQQLQSAIDKLNEEQDNSSTLSVVDEPVSCVENAIKSLKSDDI